MTKTEISHHLKTDHQHFIDQLKKMDDDSFCFALKDRWSAGQQLDHINRAVQPVVLAFGLPKFLLKLLFGKANRPSKTYDELVAKYKHKLLAGGKASGRFIPKEVPVAVKEKKLQQLERMVDSLCKKVEAHTETELDKYILPHPLLGKLTLREMLYFTTYHVQHHQQIIQRDLLQK